MGKSRSVTMVKSLKGDCNMVDEKTETDVSTDEATTGTDTAAPEAPAEPAEGEGRDESAKTDAE